VNGRDLNPNGDEEKDHGAEQGVGFCNAKHKIIRSAENTGDKGNDSCKTYNNAHDMKYFGEFHIKRV
jgi:hypothetical protein